MTTQEGSKSEQPVCDSACRRGVLSALVQMDRPVKSVHLVLASPHLQARFYLYKANSDIVVFCPGDSKLVTVAQINAEVSQLWPD